VGRDAALLVGDELVRGVCERDGRQLVERDRIEAGGEPRAPLAVVVVEREDRIRQAHSNVQHPLGVERAADAADEAHYTAVAAPRSPRYGVQRCGIRGAASLMKSTGWGARGTARSSMPTCSSERSPLRR